MSSIVGAGPVTCSFGNEVQPEITAPTAKRQAPMKPARPVIAFLVENSDIGQTTFPQPIPAVMD
jgi:hypothetical protein